jgi:iron complex outermembrane receptor protein
VPNAHRFIPDWDWPSTKIRTYPEANQEGDQITLGMNETRERGHWEGTMSTNHTTALRAALALSASALAMAMASAATAQEAPPTQPASDEVEAVVVTGFRASLQSAINIKRSSSGVVDAIKAEDIAQFPDLNLAESLQRIPGVSISRINGEGRQITVRGLGSEYTRVRINGMEAISTTGGTANSGGTNRGRGFDFNVFASDLFNSIAVRKTAPRPMSRKAHSAPRST